MTLFEVLMVSVRKDNGYSIDTEDILKPPFRCATNSVS